MMAGWDGTRRTAAVGLSVIIGTYNRADSLAFALKHFQDCRIPDGFGVELVVVDNNSSDHTSDVIARMQRDGHLQLTPVFEARQGISHARNAGIAAASGAILCTVDDDVIPDRDFFAAIMREFERRGSNTVIGGRVELWDPADLPFSVKRSRQEEQLLSGVRPGGFIHGCNMSFGRAVLNRIGGFDTRLGPGTAIPASEDSDFFYRAMRHGIPVIYCPDVVVYHNHGRRTPQQARSLLDNYDRGRGAFYMKHNAAGDRDALRILYWEILDSARAMLDPRKTRGELRWFANYARGALRYLRTRR
jgi:GT2 family glycosyltransferase